MCIRDREKGDTSRESLRTILIQNVSFYLSDHIPAWYNFPACYLYTRIQLLLTTQTHNQIILVRLMRKAVCIETRCIKSPLSPFEGRAFIYLFFCFCFLNRSLFMSNRNCADTWKTSGRCIWKCASWKTHICSCMHKCEPVTLAYLPHSHRWLCI